MYILSKDEKDPCSIKEVMLMCPIAHVPHDPVPHLDLHINKEHTYIGYMWHVPLDHHLDPPASDDLRWFK